MSRFAGKNSAFTLIELLVAISIIGLLATLSMVSYSTTQKQARDTQRKNDIKNIQSLLSSSGGKNNGLFPRRFDAVTSESSPGLCSDLGLSDCPLDPKDTSPYKYYYCSSGFNVNQGEFGATDYAIWAQMESASSTTYYVICSNGKAGESAVLPNCGSPGFNCNLP